LKLTAKFSKIYDLKCINVIFEPEKQGFGLRKVQPLLSKMQQLSCIARLKVSSQNHDLHMKKKQSAFLSPFWGGFFSIFGFGNPILDDMVEHVMNTSSQTKIKKDFERVNKSYRSSFETFKKQITA